MSKKRPKAAALRLRDKLRPNQACQAVMGWQERAAGVRFSMNAQKPTFEGAELARALPELPGVYRMYDSDERLLYVGKAKNLQKRVGTYFAGGELEPRTLLMILKVSRIETTVVRTEAEALVLESRLIKTEKPHYNIHLRDDRGYPYLHLSTDKEFPQLRVHRGRRQDKGCYFGPFPTNEAVTVAHDLLQKHFQLRTCGDSFFANRSRPCLEYQIGRCSAPCVAKISNQDYLGRVAELQELLDGKSDGLILALCTKMDEAAARLDFEAAAIIRDRVASLRAVSAKMDMELGENSLDAVALCERDGITCISMVFVRQGKMLGSRSFYPNLKLEAGPAEVLGQFLAQYYLDKPRPPEVILDREPDEIKNLSEAIGAKIKVDVKGDRARHLAAAIRNAEAGLASRLKSKSVTQLQRADLAKTLGLTNMPERIECFDISHTQGELAVASCVVFGPDGPIKSAYRRYNISGITPGDDYAAMRQALTRRFSGQEAAPELLLIDGGKGQVKQAVVVKEALDIQTMIVGVAKGEARKAGEETLIFEDGREEIKLGARSMALCLIQQVRDEAHRFAIEGHRKKRDKARSTSSLEGIAGVGAARRRALLRAFGGMQGVMAAGSEELQRTGGIGKALADAVYAALHGG
jgi:excinuclease ABC subunit C